MKTVDTIKWIALGFVFALVSVVPTSKAAEPKKEPAIKSEAKQEKSALDTKKSKGQTMSTGEKSGGGKGGKKASLSKTIEAWLNNMKKRVERSKAKQNQIVSVAAVRGDEQPDSPPLYWKGKKAEAPVGKDELDEFDSAVDTALIGQSQEAVGKLEKFLSDHPKSVLVDDVQGTLNMLKESGKP